MAPRLTCLAPGGLPILTNYRGRMWPRSHFFQQREPMDSEQKLLVQTSFQAVLAIADTAAQLFYARLFELDPKLQPLFKGDMATQRRKLMTTLEVAVRGLDRLDQIVPSLQALGRGHVKYGVEDAHYDTVGAALIWTLEKGLGEAFTPAVKDAWVAVYTLLAGVMKDAAARMVVQRMPVAHRKPLAEAMPVSQRLPTSMRIPVSQRMPLSKRMPF